MIALAVLSPPSAASDNVWTGLHDPQQMGFYTWSDGHMTSFTHWAPGEPNNHQGFKEDCVEMLYEVRRTEKLQVRFPNVRKSTCWGTLEQNSPLTSACTYISLDESQCGLLVKELDR